MRFMGWVLLVLLLFSCSLGGGGQVAPPPSVPDGISIATGSPQGPYYSIGTGLMKIYERDFASGVATSVQSTDGTVENLELLREGKVEMALAMADTASFYLGGPSTDLRAMAALYSNHVQIVTLQGSSIHRVEDLRGKKVGVGAPNSGVEANSRSLLHAYGIQYEDFEPHYLSYAEAMEQLRQRTIDAAFVTSGLPNPTVLEMLPANGHGVRMIPIPMEEAERLAEGYPFFRPSEIPAGMYHNEAAIPTVAIQNMMLVRQDLPEEKVYHLTRVLFENLEELGNYHEAAKDIQLERAWANLPVPYHSGAERFFREQGVVWGE